MATETSTLMSTQNADNVAITGGTMTGVNVTQPSGRVGTLIANQTTPVTISSSIIAITDIFVFSLNTVGGTVGQLPHVVTIAAGQVSVAATASDTSTYNYTIIKPA